MDETLEECVIRELKEETGLVVTEVKPIGSYSRVDRDPRGRTITIAYLIVVDEELPVKGQDDAKQAKWWPLNDLPELAFDHSKILNDTLETLK